MTSPPPLDHLILLVPTLDPAATSFLSSGGFELIPGGTHADGLTENALIVLSDGVYIEVIAFTAATTPETRARHWWGAKADGWIDWSLGPTPVSAAERVHRANASAGTTIYDAPVAGGRVTKDGSKHVQWKVAFPVLANGERRGVKPFWCEDVTERGWRVPEPAPHPNGATGIHALTLLAPPGDLEAYLTTLSPILSVAPAAALHQFEIATPVGSSVQVFVREPADEGEVAWVAERGAGLWEVELATAAGASRVKIGASAGARLVL